MSSPTIDQLELFLGDLPMGRLLYRASDRRYALELTEGFLNSRHEIAPIIYPFLDAFRGGLVEYHGDPAATSPFAGGLPGFVADSLPDRWGALIAQLEDPVRAASLMGMLARVGAGGQGAIIFREPNSPTATPTAGIQERLADLAIRAARIYQQTGGNRLPTLPFSSGGSLGGIYPKAAVQLPVAMRNVALMSSPEVLIGGTPRKGCIPCIVKFSPVPDDEDQGAVEYAFHSMAKDAGLRLPAACLLEDDAGGKHFAVERFDRQCRDDGTIKRLHVQSLSALLHRSPVGALRYEDLLVAASILGGPPEALEAFRRIVFNLLATNRDDHGRNHAFLYDPDTRVWSLAPAYDLNPSVSECLNAVRWGDGTELPTRFADLLQLAKSGGVSETQAVAIFRQIEASIARWPEFAQAAGVRESIARIWGEGILSETKQGGPLRADVRRWAARKPLPKLPPEA